jgi:hypothetical protein
MTQTHVTDSAAAPEPVTTVTLPKRDRAAYMREYRARQNNKSETPELNNNSPEITPDIPPPPELNCAPQPAPGQKPEVELPRPDEAAEALRKQVEELRKSELLLRQHQGQQQNRQQQEENYLRYLRQTFQYWKQNGLTSEAEQFLLAGPPTIIDELTQFAGQQAVAQGHQAGSAEHEQAAQKIFHDSLEHLREQARHHAPAQQSSEPMPTTNNIEPAMTSNDFFKPPEPKPVRQHVPVSAPVSRTVPTGSGSRPDWETGKTVLTAEEKEHARLAGVSETDYARGKLRLQRERAEGIRQ